MFYKKLQKRMTAVLSVMLFPLFVTPLFSQEGSRDVFQPQKKLYREAVELLRHGTAYQRIKAAQLLGSYRDAQYVRPLVQVLLEHLEQPLWRKSAINDPYVKSWIAWALGEIGHPLAIEGLLTALAKTEAIIKQEIEELRQRKAAYDQLSASRGETSTNQSSYDRVDYILLETDRPGPFIKGGHRFPYGGDQNWNISDRVKHTPIDLKDERHRLLLEGANYTNLLRAIFLALGRIKDDKATERLLVYLDPLQYSIFTIRFYAAVSLGEIASATALRGLNARFNSEPDQQVKLQIAFAIMKIDRNNTVAYDFLIKALESDSPRMRLASAFAFDRLIMASALLNLREAYKVEDQLPVRRALKEAIQSTVTDRFLLPASY